ncbi:MAG TPA: hypothetical protein VLL52_19400 [Anaerolineae bacterium]|nr:hypothetical protein [Anaerolineae bacterium]
MGFDADFGDWTDFLLLVRRGWVFGGEVGDVAEGGVLFEVGTGLSRVGGF